MPYKYFAFISYSSKDTSWGKKLQRKLEHYRMPATLCSEHNWASKTPIRPVFFAPTDIQPGGLTEEQKQRLQDSRHLIVICSPNSAQSEWVGREIAFFHSLGRTKDIHFFIVDGVPNSGNPDTECFNPIIKQLGISEILGANIHEHVSSLPWINRERAYVQLITKLLGIEFDTLWQRHRRMFIQQVCASVIALLCVCCAIALAYRASRPVEVKVALHELTPRNTHLPALKNARVWIDIPGEVKDTVFADVDQAITFVNIPSELDGEAVGIHFRHDDYNPIDTTVTLDGKVTLNISRNPKVYGQLYFTIYDGDVTPVPNATVSIKGVKATSNDRGQVAMLLPIEKQDTLYEVESDVLTLSNNQLGSGSTYSSSIYITK